MARALRFRPDATFTIVQFTDVHWRNGDESDRRTADLMRLVIEAERPDLVVFTGDLIESAACDHPGRSLLQAVATAEEREIPWAAVFGNHDSEKGSRAALAAAIERHCRHSMFRRGPSNLHGVGNYCLPVCDAGGHGERALLWFFDSGSYAPFRLGPYEWIHRDQIRWYQQESARRARRAGGRLPALAFFHIPLPEYRRVWKEQVCYGEKHERVCSPLFNSGLFRAMAQQGDVIATFCGHDHLNDYWGELNGIRLTYGRATGYNTYGREGFPRGARIIRLDEGERRCETWLRLAGGRAVHEPPVHQPTGRE